MVDLNGGDANPGDVLRYTIDLRETAGVAASGVRVVDAMPGRVTGFTVTSLPAGAVNVSTGAPSGANGTGQLDETRPEIARAFAAAERILDLPQSCVHLP